MSKQGYSYRSERSGGARRVLACIVRLDLIGSRRKPNLFDKFRDTSRVTTKLSINVYQYHLLLAFREVYQQRSVFVGQGGNTLDLFGPLSPDTLDQVRLK